MIGEPWNLLIIGAGGGLEPPQGYPYRILSSRIQFSSSVYRATPRRIIRVSISLLPGCARRSLMVWAQYGHSKPFFLRIEGRVPVD